MSASELSRLSIDRRAAIKGGPQRRRWRWWVAAIVVLLIAAVLLAQRYAGAVTVEAVSVTTAYPAQAITVLNATGYVVAQRKASIASKATGRLEWLGVAEGSKVEEGEIIARLENRDVAAAREQAQAGVKVAQANVEQASADLRDAQRAFKRSEELIGKRYISEAAHDAARARMEIAKAALSSRQASLSVARANLEAAEVGFDQTLIRAPFDGVVLTKNANVGDNITPFSNALDTKGAVVTMADMTTLEVEADVAESSLGRISVGQPVEIQLDALPDERFAGQVNRIVPTVDRAKATVLVKIRFNEGNDRVLPDMSTKVAFLERALKPEERKPVTAVQVEAVLRDDTSASVLRLKDGRAERVPVQTGATLGELLEVRGVQPGDRVVLKPLDAALDGRKVAVEQKP
ncbi:MAG TPA: efflux RND transporter periplasmic adaptor subunit [Steroidobacteraceae bacterium]|nr:efflux RND transporter periplasmic adaptor subunit [Steroidobacteraceae bacterium]